MTTDSNREASPQTPEQILPSEDLFPREEIRTYFDNANEMRTYNPLDDKRAAGKLLVMRSKWANQDQVSTAFTLGVFDMFHGNHRAYLLHTKLSAAKSHYETYYKQSYDPEWAMLTDEERHEIGKYFLSRDELKLIVSIDGNQAVSGAKGNNHAKGNTTRPVFDWQTRARDVLSVAVEIDDDKWSPVVDAVTMHDNTEPSLEGTPFQTDLDMVKFLNPDTWAIYFEAEKTIEQASEMTQGEFGGKAVVIVNTHDYYEDELLGGGFSTTRILGRMAGN